MRLKTLYFAANRPTIGALMALGSDVGAAFSSGKPEVQGTDQPALHGLYDLQASAGKGKFLSFLAESHCGCWAVHVADIRALRRQRLWRLHNPQTRPLQSRPKLQSSQPRPLAKQRRMLSSPATWRVMPHLP